MNQSPDLQIVPVHNDVIVILKIFDQPTNPVIDKSWYENFSGPTNQPMTSLIFDFFEN